MMLRSYVITRIEGVWIFLCESWEMGEWMSKSMGRYSSHAWADSKDAR